MPKIKVTLSIGLANASQEDVIEIDDTEWGECETEEQRNELIDTYWQNWSREYIDGGAELIG